VAHAERDLLDRGADHGQGPQDLGVAIARDDLGGDGLGREAQLAQASRSICGSRLP
jgi:hypothetical protein